MGVFFEKLVSCPVSVPKKAIKERDKDQMTEFSFLDAIILGTYLGQYKPLLCCGIMRVAVFGIDGGY